MNDTRTADPSDAERLDWYESKHTLHKDLELLYVVDGYELSIMDQDGQKVVACYSGKNIRECIDAAMREEIMERGEAGAVGKSETPQGGVGTQMPGPGSIPGALRCWICEKWYTGMDCPTCGPPVAWGPTSEELARG